MSSTIITVQVANSPAVTFTLAESSKLDEILTQLAQVRTDIQEFRNAMQLTEQQTTDLLNAIDTTTNATAVNITTIGTAAAAIKAEVDAFVETAAASGTPLTDAQVAQLQSIATRAQAMSDGSMAQATALQGIAAEGQPVTPAAPAPVVVPPAPAQP